MKKVDFGIFLNHPSLIVVFILLLAAVIFLPPRLKVRSWRRQKSKMDQWFSQKPMPELTTQTSCVLCGGSRINRRVTEVLPEQMASGLLTAKKSGQITYAEYRCAGCGSEIGRLRES